jgi:hypothetical protein
MFICEINIFITVVFIVYLQKFYKLKLNIMTEGNDSVHPILENNLSGYSGLTKREHFAAMAMQGIYAGSSLALSIGSHDNKTIAITAVNAADVLIKALNQ